MSVIESVIPKSKKTILPASFPDSISLGILPKPFFPLSVVQLNLKESSDLLIIVCDGMLTFKETLLFDNWHSPLLPSENDNETGTLASLTIVAHEVKIKQNKINSTFFTKEP